MLTKLSSCICGEGSSIRETSKEKKRSQDRFKRLIEPDQPLPCLPPKQAERGDLQGHRHHPQGIMTQINQQRLVKQQSPVQVARAKQIRQAQHHVQGNLTFVRP